MRLADEVDWARAWPLHLRPGLELGRRPIRRPVPVANPRAPYEPAAASAATAAGRQPPAATAAPASASASASASATATASASATASATATSASASARRELRQRAVPLSQAGQSGHHLGGAG